MTTHDKRVSVAPAAAGERDLVRRTAAGAGRGFRLYPFAGLVPFAGSRDPGGPAAVPLTGGVGDQAVTGSAPGISGCFMSKPYRVIPCAAGQPPGAAR